MAMIQDCDTAVSRICDMCGWAEDLKKLILQGDAPHEHKAKTTTNHTTTCTTKPKEVKQKYTSYKPISKNKSDHTHRTKRTTKQ